MSIVNYPNRIYSGKDTAIDRQLAKRKPITVRGRQDISATALDVIVTTETDWQLDSISFVFSNANARDYAAKVMDGKRVVTDRNDYLWFVLNSGSGYTLPQMITLDDGFYNGDQLATQLQTQMNANAQFSAHGVTFTVAYASATGFFTITPSSGTLKYLNVNTQQTISTRDSIAGHLFGLTADQGFAASIVTDTAQFGLLTEASIVNQTAATHIQHYHDDLHNLSIDQALHLTSNSGVNVAIDYTVVYEDLV